MPEGRRECAAVPGHPLFSGLDGMLLLCAGFAIRGDARNGLLQYVAIAVVVAIALRRVARATRTR